VSLGKKSFGDLKRPLFPYGSDKPRAAIVLNCVSARKIDFRSAARPRDGLRRLRSSNLDDGRK